MSRNLFKYLILWLLPLLCSLSLHAQFEPMPGYEPPAIPDTAASRAVVEYVPLQAYSTVSDVIAPANAGRVITTTTYKDGSNQSYYISSRDNVSGKNRIAIQQIYPRQEDKGYLPFSHTGTLSRFNLETAQAAYYSSAYPGEVSGGSSNSAARTFSTSDATKRSHKVLEPGSTLAGENRGTEVTKVTNPASLIRIWVPTAAGGVSSPGYYGAGELQGQKTVEANGQIHYSFKDKSGKMIMTSIGEYTSAASMRTQYVYDDYERLRFTLSPNASTATTSTAVNATVLANLCFTYQYDHRSRLVAERKPGETGFTELVYDRKQRVVMRRSPLEAAKGLWEVIFYDKKGRTIATALLTSSQSGILWQSEVDGTLATATLPATNLLRYLGTTAGEGQHPTATITGLQYQSYSYYDHYNHSSMPESLPYSPSMQSAETSTGVETVAKLNYVQGMPTLSRVRVLKTTADDNLGDWEASASYYDVKGRLMGVHATHAVKNSSGQGWTKSGFKYDFNGRVLLTKQESYNAAAGHTVTEYNKNEYYTGSNRLSRSWHKTGAAEGPWIIARTLSYDDMGRVSREVLGNGGETRDYKYNIRGQLASINGVYAETGDKEGQNRTFGEVLEYDKGANPSKRYDGRISSMTWRGSGGNKMRYLYSYDVQGRLSVADFAEYRGSSWTKTQLDYTVNNLSYDRNGNMLSMRQYGVGFVDTALRPIVMDELQYTYPANSNRLQAVSDTATVNYNLGDFQNGHTGTTDYAYDASGNLTEDKNKGITSVSYTYFNKPELISFSNGNTIRYVYNAAGSKLREVVKEGTATTRRDYVGNGLYKNDTLQYLSTAAGRTIYRPATGYYEEEYFVKDHIGNVRSVIAVETTPFTLEYLATYELFSAYIEGIFFDKLGEIREWKPGGTPGNQYSGKLQAPDAAVGTSLVLKVMAGDQVELGVWNMYETAGSDGTLMSEQTLLQNVLTVLSQGPGGIQGENGSVQMLNQLFSMQNMAQFQSLYGSSMDPSRPPAALNYMLFNMQYQINTDGSGILQADGADDWTAMETPPMLMRESGYLSVYLTNRSTGRPVYFDDLRIRLTRGVLREETHYYPHGLPMGYMGTAAAGSVENREKHQGNEYIRDAGLNWMSFGFREYDPQIGRFLSVDPLADYYGQNRYSPYAAMGNQPESMVDPNGLSFRGGTDPTLMTRARDYGEQWGYQSWGRSVIDLILRGNQDAANPLGVGSSVGFNTSGNWGNLFGSNSLEYWSRVGFWSSIVSRHLGQAGGGGDGSPSVPNPGGTTNRYSIPNGDVDNNIMDEFVVHLIRDQPDQKQSKSDVMLSALAIAGTTSLADGPLPVGEIVGGAIVLGTAGYLYGESAYEFNKAVATVLVDKMAREIDRILRKAKGPDGYVYELRVRKSGNYMDVRGNSIYLNAGDIWKFGESTKNTRYSQPVLDNMVPGGVRMNKIYHGSRAEIKVFEKYAIYGYFMINMSLPPGNHIFR